VNSILTPRRGAPTIRDVSESSDEVASPRFSPVIALIAVSAMWEGQLTAALRDLGLSTRKFGLLGHIGSEPGISFSELARRSHITVQTAHTAVRALVDDGLVQDATSHAGAASDLHVTADGQRVLIEARRRLFALDGQLSDGLPKVADSLDGIRAGIV
jgi:DNA-binding MarR family transcriptional regulator